jgi:hypothetical protein
MTPIAWIFLSLFALSTIWALSLLARYQSLKAQVQWTNDQMETFDPGSWFPPPGSSQSIFDEPIQNSDYDTQPDLKIYTPNRSA